MFLGKYPCALDGNNRLPVPTAFRGQLSGNAYITQGFERNLLIFSAAAFQDVYRRIRSLNIADPLARALFRLILGTARELGMDSNYRFTIPEELRKFADLGDNVLLIGQGEYLEIWSPGLWETQETQLKDAEANSGRFSALIISTQ